MPPSDVIETTVAEVTAELLRQGVGPDEAVSILESQRRPKPPLFFKLFGIFAVLRRIPARLIGVGVGIRPEHVRTPEAAPDY